MSLPDMEKNNNRNTRAAVRRLVPRRDPADPRFATASDNRRSETGGNLSRRHGPVLVDGRNDQPAGPHLEGFSEGVLNFYIIDVHLIHAP